MPRLNDMLSDVTRICLDTMALIYFVEANPRYVPLVRPLFQRISVGSLSGVVSTITLLEVLVQPLRLGIASLADSYRDLLTDSENFEMLPLTSAIAEVAAELRARYGLRTADAIVAATAIQSGCQALVTNDGRLARLAELRVILLDDIAL